MVQFVFPVLWILLAHQAIRTRSQSIGIGSLTTLAFSSSLSSFHLVGSESELFVFAIVNVTRSHDKTARRTVLAIVETSLIPVLCIATIENQIFFSLTASTVVWGEPTYLLSLEPP